MESAMVVSSSEKGLAYFAELLHAASVGEVASTPTGAEARGILSGRGFDLVLINAPLRDESGIDLARQIASEGVSQVILAVRGEHYDAVSALCEENGALAIAKPVNKSIFFSALKLAGATQSRLRSMQDENSRLKQTIEDIRIIDRAKCLLISYLSMSEQEAHRYIEKQAMDMRAPKRAIAEGILRTYES
jgi:response regulator NasT